MKITTSGGLRFKKCALCGEMHEVANWPDNHVQPLAAPMVIRDDMPAIQSMVDGSWHESKRGIRKTYEPSGNAEGKKYQELGNEAARNKPFERKSDRKGIRQSIEKATAQLRNGQTTEKTTKKLLSRPGPVLSRNQL